MVFYNGNKVTHTEVKTPKEEPKEPGGSPKENPEILITQNSRISSRPRWATMQAEL